MWAYITSLSILTSLREYYQLLVLYGFAISVLFLMMMVLWLRMRYRRKQANERADVLRSIVNDVRTSKPLDENLKQLLYVIRKWVGAPYYVWYLRDVRTGQFQLRAVTRPVDPFQQVGPSYSGLAVSRKDIYLPAVSIPAKEMPDDVSIIHQGEVPLLALPLPNREAMVLVGPLEHITRPVRRELAAFLKDIDPVISDLLAAELERDRAQVAVVSQRAIQNIASIASDVAGMWELAVRAFVGTNGSVGGCYVERQTVDRTWAYRLFTAVGNVKEVEDVLRTDVDTLADLFSFVAQQSHMILAPGNPEYYRLPTYLVTLGLGAVGLMRLGEHGLLVVLYDKSLSEGELQKKSMTQLMMVSTELAEISRQQADRRHFADAYLSILKQLSNMLDNLNPYTVGYSELVTRFSLVIGKEMGLSESELYDLAVAAHLSNLGVLGRDMELLFKEGKYTALEYETMKLHTEIGSSMVQIATGNRRVASYIMHHHERVDGHGYPSGLKGDEIPNGARILSVVQTFLAKINGRKSRDPLPFEQAIQTIRSVAGSQLDKRAVEALVHWFEKKRSAADGARSLGRCFEMCCVPASICESCPAFHRTDVNCWEVEGNLCQAHGRSCGSCFVKTEYLARTSKTPQHH